MATTLNNNDDETLPVKNTTSEIDFAQVEYLPSYLVTFSVITFYFHFVLTSIAFLSIITTIKLKVSVVFVHSILL